MPLPGQGRSLNQSSTSNSATNLIFYFQDSRSAADEIIDRKIVKREAFQENLKGAGVFYRPFSDIENFSLLDESSDDRLEDLTEFAGSSIKQFTVRMGLSIPFYQACKILSIA